MAKTRAASTCRWPGPPRWYGPVLGTLASALVISCTGSSPTAPSPTPGSPSVASTSPTVTAVSPAAGVQGTTVNVALTGLNFVPGETTAVVVSGVDVDVRGVAVQSATSATATFAIAPTAALGPRSVTVTTATGGTGEGRPFTVNPPPPTLTSLSPATGVAGTSMDVTLTGTNFVPGGTDVEVLGAGITVGDVRVADATTLTASFVIGPAADLGGHTVTVTTAGGTTAAQTFIVEPGVPTLTGLSVTSGVQGTSVDVTLTGTNFVPGGTDVQVSGSGVTVTNVRVGSGLAGAIADVAGNSTTITAIFVIAADAPLGVRGVTVTTAGGTSGALPFTVIAAPPSIGALTASPATITAGESSTLSWSGITHATSCAIDQGVGTVSCGNASTSVSPAGTTTYRLTAEGAGGSATATATVTVNPAAPTLTSISPTSGVQGNAINVTLTGTNFLAGATVAVSGSGVTVSNVTVVSGTSITATFTIDGGAATGARNVTVTTAGGTTGAQTFTVNQPAPTLTSISPTSGVQGNAINVTLTGTNFLAGATVAVSGTGVTASNVTVVSGTSITATFTIGGGAATGARNVTVTTAGGTTGAQTFTVNPPPPTLTSIDPTSGVPATAVDVTLTGTNFVSGATVAVSGSGVTVIHVTIVSGTSITATFLIDGPGVATGARNVTVTTSGGTSGAQTFTVQDPPCPSRVIACVAE
jgi:hypothetical protein